jgi:leucyl/phenylalanyl-tRNA---protein transferase
MPVYRLEEDVVFPHPSEAEKDGLLAIGGDLSIERLLLAYANGIFPWYSEDTPILWWSPNPRMILFPEKFKISKSLKQKIRNTNYEVRFDTAFEEVIEECKVIKRKGEDGTWIIKEMKEAYIALHHLGFAHSVEIFIENNLVGGLYGVSLGAAFFGESMFSKVSDSSKIAMYHLTEFSKKQNFHFIDCQMYTEHLESLGAEELEQSFFLKRLEKAMKEKTLRGVW